MWFITSTVFAFMSHGYHGGIEYQAATQWAAYKVCLFLYYNHATVFRFLFD